MKTNKVVIVIGPTATKKTTLSISIAKQLNGELVNADCFQVYKQLNIGVNKQTKEELQDVKLHLTNLIDYDQNWDVAQFKLLAEKTIDQIIEQNKLPIVVGGSHLYNDALIYNYDLNYHPKRSNQYDQWTNEQLYEYIAHIDLEHAQKITKNNRKRLLRAVELYASNNNQKQTLKKRLEPKYEFLIIVCMLDDRQLMYEKINQRVLKMLSDGWIDECKQLLKNDANILNYQSMKAIGYDLIINAIKNDSAIDVEKIQQKTRQFAKRQLTWIRHHYQDYLVYDLTNEKEIINQIKQWINK